MKYYSCLTDKIDGMKSCGLKAADSSPELEIEAANRTISFKNIGYSNGQACYYMLGTNSSWSNSSKVFIYPSELSGVTMRIANGSSRMTAKDYDVALGIDKSYNFTAGQEIYILV